MTETTQVPGIGENFDVQKFIRKIIAHWKLYAISLIVFLSAAYLYVHYSTPLYSANAQVLIQNDKRNSASSFLQTPGAGNFGDVFVAKNNLGDQLAILKTPDLFRQVVPVLNLNVAYFHKGQVRDVELYDGSPFYIYFEPKQRSFGTQRFELNQNGKDTNSFVIAQGKTLSKTGKFGDTLTVDVGKICISRVSDLGKDGYYFTLASTDVVAAGIMGSVTVSALDKDANVINLYCNSNVPQKAADILGTLIDKYIERSLNEKNRIADSLISFIDGRIDLVANDLNNIEARIQGFKQDNKLTNIEAQSTALIANTSDYYNKLNDIDVQLNIMNSMLEAVENDSKRPVPALFSNDASFTGLSEQYNALLAQRQKLLLSTTEGNPLIKNIDAQLANVRSDIVRNLQNQQKALQISRQQIAGSNAKISNMVANAPVQERKFIDLSRERDVKQSIYLFLLQKKEETSITKASTISGATVIKEPQSSWAPFFPNPSTAYSVGLGLGLIVPFSLLWIAGLVNSKIGSTEDVINGTKVPVIAEIGHSENAGLLSLKEESRSTLAEQFRVFRTNMDFLIAGTNCPKILITSTTAGEGKSFIASNLSQIYGYSGKRVLLMELDLRQPKISQLFGVPGDHGFSNYVIADKPIEDFIQAVPNTDNVFLLSSGPIPPNPAELLLHKKVGVMFTTLSELFDVIIIDSPPIGMVTDAQIIGAHSNVSLYIVRPGFSKKDSINIINNISENEKLPAFYLTVNDIKANSDYKYGYGSNYGYSDYHANGSAKKRPLSRIKK